MRFLKIYNKALVFFQQHSLMLGLFIVYILFHTFFEQIIDRYFVVTFVSHLKSSILNDVILGFLFIIIIINAISSRIINFFLSSKNALSSFLLFLLIGYYRFLSDHWSFAHFSFSQYLKYIDIFLLFLFGNIIIYFTHSLKRYQTEPLKGFCFDDPIEKSEEDTLKRNGLAEKIAMKILNTANPKASFAVGIASEWGWGKTSFLNLIKSHLNEERRIVLDFNPWLNNDEKAIVKSFFDELSSKLRKYNKELSGDLKKYSEMLNSISDRTKTLHYALTVFYGENDLRQQFDSINEAIKSCGFQIVIFIDDLDRLYENEILEVLRLIRNSASFSNTVFVVAYDRNYLISALKEANEYHPEFYMEKIFQVEIALPSFENQILTGKLQQLLNPHLSKTDRTIFRNIIDDSLTKGSFCNDNYFGFHLLSNIRDVNRFVNSFIISYEALKGEIVLLDLLNIELLRAKFLGVYNLLATNRNPFLDAKYIRNSNFLTLAKVKDKDEKELEKTILEDYLEKSYPNVGIQLDQITLVLKYVRCVFSDYDIYSVPQPRSLSISNPISIDRYFHYNLLDSNLSEIEFSEFRQKSEVEFQAKIKEWTDKGLANEVSRKLMHIEFYLNKDDFETVIKSIFYLASLPVDNNETQIGFDFENLYNKLQYKKVQSFYTEEEFKFFVTEIFENQELPYSFISNLIYYIFDRQNITNWDFILNKEHLNQKKIDYFSKYASQISSIDRHVFYLFHYCKHKNWISNGGNSYSSEEVMPEQAKEIFKKCASTLPESFIKNIITSNFRIGDREKMLFSITHTMKLIWENWENFEAFIFNLEESEINGLKEFKVFFEKCKRVNFERYVDFNFEEINLSDAILFNS